MAHDEGLEERLQSALEQLQRGGYSKGWTEWGNAFAEWRTMSGLMQLWENAALASKRHGLEQARAEFGRAAAQVCREDERDKRRTGGRSSQRSIRKRWSWNDHPAATDV
ncbi:MbeD/MobD family mobilization/exclusion protein [Pantoea stewartii]|uniref:MbeD/MobD family mobilization/exclusion protein n=1 Tax=Pantoea stewartii TaxID=66269 RepID=UPI003DA6F8BE